MKKSTGLTIIIVFAVIVLTGLVILKLTMKDQGGLQPAFDAEFMTRPDGYIGLQKHYGFKFASAPKQMDPGLMYRAIADGEVDVIDGFATDGRIPAYKLLVLEDDKNFFPPYYAAPMINSSTLKKHPELEKVLNLLAGKISDKKMQELNYEADEKGRKADDIAREFLIKADLIDKDTKPGDGSAGTVTIGSKHFTEQEILGEIMSILIENKTDLKVERKLNLSGTMICFNGLKSGDLDIYAEYTGTGLVNILDMAVISDLDKTYETVKNEFQEKYSLKWLKPFGFNNTYTLTMRKKHAEKLGIKSISDLAAYVSKSE